MRVFARAYRGFRPLNYFEKIAAAVVAHVLRITHTEPPLCV